MRRTRTAECCRSPAPTASVHGAAPSSSDCAASIATARPPACCRSTRSEGGAPGDAWGCSAGGVPAFNPDAAIVNYYRAGDTLNGHQDDVEEDLRQPIVSLSVGCDAVFLIGGRTKAVPPTALLLSSGDVIVMRSDARLSFHGAPADADVPTAWSASRRAVEGVLASAALALWHTRCVGACRSSTASCLARPAGHVRHWRCIPIGHAGGHSHEAAGLARGYAHVSSYASCSIMFSVMFSVMF